MLILWDNRRESHWAIATKWIITRIYLLSAYQLKRYNGGNLTVDIYRSYLSGIGSGNYDPFFQNPYGVTGKLCAILSDRNGTYALYDYWRSYNLMKHHACFRLILHTVAIPPSASLAIWSVDIFGCFAISDFTWSHNVVFRTFPYEFQSSSANFLLSNPCLIRSTRLPCCYPPTETFQTLQSGLEVPRAYFGPS